MGAERCGCRQMGPAFLDETGTTCFSSCLLFKGEEELNFQGKGERERLASLSFQTFKGGNSVQVLLDLAGPSWEAGWRQEWKRGLMRDLKTSDKKGCEYARSLASLLPFLTSDPVGGARSLGTPGKGGQDGGRFYTWDPNASYRKKPCLFATPPAPVLTYHCTLLEPV